MYQEFFSKSASLGQWYKLIKWSSASHFSKKKKTGKLGTFYMSVTSFDISLTFGHHLFSYNSK